jgi:hypothetical protein
LSTADLCRQHNITEQTYGGCPSTDRKSPARKTAEVQGGEEGLVCCLKIQAPDQFFCLLEYVGVNTPDSR